MQFFIPNALNRYRVKTFSSKEPETLTWIESFDKESVFWDIGANIGLYSIYAAKYNNAQVYAFEPSVFNLELLAKNIHCNTLSEKVRILPIALTSHSGFNLFRMNNPVWGGALSTFGEDYDQHGKSFNTTFEYIFPGVTADKVVELLFVPKPDYLKIDVDGIEHLVLEGCGNILKVVKSVLIEINDDFEKQSHDSKKHLLQAGLVLRDKFYLGSGNHYNQLWVREG
ncbi:FkbM family methyltransferase [Candidatus Thioglobus sp.]|nr:FkbM family methyltransferase [Candidatus Thioglobus sp.]